MGLAGAALLPQGAGAQTFDCRYAQRPAERAICQDRILSQLDVQMSNLYFSLINRVGPHMARIIRADQQAWLRDRNACGYHIGCVDSAYRRRISQLLSY
jgi:uncharacterized protein